MTSSSATNSFTHLSERELLEALDPRKLSFQHRLEPVVMSSVLVEAITRRVPVSGIPTLTADEAYQYLASCAFQQSPWGKQEVATALIAKYKNPEGNTPRNLKSPEKAITIQKTLIESATELLVLAAGAHPYERFILEGLKQRHEDPTCSTWVKAASRLAPTNRSHQCREALSALILKGLRHPDSATKKEALEALPNFMSALPDYSDRLGRAFGDCLNSLQMDVFLTAAQNSEAVIQAARPPFLISLKNRFNEITGQPTPAIDAQLDKALIKMGHHPAKPFRF